MAPGRPVCFDGTLGLFHPGAAPSGAGPLAVLMLSPLGYEEMCGRTTWRSLAEGIAAAGLPCLRYDHPGTGDALDAAGEPEGIADWCRAAHRAAALLRGRTGCAALALVGQGFGAALAARLAAEIGDVVACVFLAPVTDGPRYIRELGLWARMVAERIGVGPDPDDPGGCGVAGFTLPPARVAAIRALGPLTAPPAPHALVAARPGRPGDAAFADRLAALGVAVTTIPYAGYDRLTVDPTVAVPPADTVAAVAAWLAGRAAALPRPAARGRVLAGEEGGTLRGSGFTERPLRFGPGERLFGVLCRPTAGVGRPAGGAGGPVAVFVGPGRDYHVGLGRATVAQARAFAARGIASLRFDASGIGDSPPAPDGPAEILYSADHVADVGAAIDRVVAAGLGPVTLVGRCSGAHAAFHAAVADPRVARVVLLNLSRFLWDPADDVAESLRYGHRSLGDFGATLRARDGFGRLLRGELRLAAAGRHLAGRLGRDAGLLLAPLTGSVTRQGRHHRAVHAHLATLARRGVPVSLIFSAGDSGLGEIRRTFGRRGLAPYPNLSLALVEDADHSFTHAGARDRLMATLLAAVAP